MKAIAALMMLLGVVASGAIGALAAESISFETTELTIESADGRQHSFTVELAETVRQRSRGLMYRDRLAPDAGMLFVYPEEQEIRMWMRNTLIPLDMLFVASDGTILRIAENTVPLSEEIVASQGPAQAVIELNGGTARSLGIRPGDQVRHPLLGGG